MNLIYICIEAYLKLVLIEKNCEREINGSNGFKQKRWLE